MTERFSQCLRLIQALTSTSVTKPEYGMEKIIR